MAKDHSSHIRSTSLPSTSHPLTSRVEELLNKLGRWIALSSFQTKENLQDGLRALIELYECVEDLFQLPHIQRVLVQQQDDKCVNDLLDGSVRMLDVSSATRDVLLQLKEYVQETQLSLCRRRGEFNFRNEVEAYVLSRKRINKVINKCLGNFRKIGSKHSISLLVLDNDHDLIVVVNVLREVEAISLTVFQSLFSFISGQKTLRKRCGRSLVSKLMHNKRVMCEEQQESGNEIAKADASVIALSTHKLCHDDKFATVSNAQKQLEALEVITESLEEGLMSVSRQMIKTRVSLLNTLSN